jgi:hypothetical protein
MICVYLQFTLTEKLVPLLSKIKTKGGCCSVDYVVFWRRLTFFWL